MSALRRCPGRRLLVLGNHDVGDRERLRDVGFVDQQATLCATDPPWPSRTSRSGRCRRLRSTSTGTCTERRHRAHGTSTSASSGPTTRPSASTSSCGGSPPAGSSPAGPGHRRRATRWTFASPPTSWRFRRLDLSRGGAADAPAAWRDGPLVRPPPALRPAEGHRLPVRSAHRRLHRRPRRLGRRLRHSVPRSVGKRLRVGTCLLNDIPPSARRRLFARANLAQHVQSCDPQVEAPLSCTGMDRPSAPKGCCWATAGRRWVPALAMVLGLLWTPSAAGAGAGRLAPRPRLGCRGRTVGRRRGHRGCD